MSEFGLTEKGFKRKRYIDILESLQANAKSIFGRDINVNTNSPLGMMLKVIAFEMADEWQQMENTYYSGYKDTATGYQVDAVGQYIGAKRKGATYATGIETFVGTPGTVIPANYVVAFGNVNFWTLQQATIGGTGNIDVNIQCIEVGSSGNVAAGKITKIVSALSGVTSVTNALETSGGKEVEDTTTFKARYDDSIAGGGSSTAASVEAALLAIPTVTDAKVTENDTVATVNGIPPKCLSSFVYGGSDTEVANAIYKSKGGGIQAFGATYVGVTDSKGITHQMGFTRATEVPVYIHITLTKDTELYPANGDASIKTAIIEYIGGLDADSTEYNGMGLGADVIYTKLIGLCHKVSGVTDVTVTVSTDNATFTSANIVIGANSVAMTDYNKVVIA